jgi:hypothetical protein
VILEVIAAHGKNSDCLKCGKLDYSWNNCWATEPNGSTGGSDKREGDSNNSQNSSSFKKPKTSLAAAAIALDPGRMIDIPKEDEDLNYDI